MKSNNTVVISNKATLTSNGNHFHGNCEPVVAVDLQMTFNSRIDLAEYCHVSTGNVSDVLSGRCNTIGVYKIDENGNKYKVGSTRVMNARDAQVALDTIMEAGRNTKAELEKVKAENESLNAEMAEFRAWKAEQERIRKEKEEREKKKAKLCAKMEMHERMLARVETERERILNLIAKDHARLAELDGATVLPIEVA